MTPQESTHGNESCEVMKEEDSLPAFNRTRTTTSSALFLVSLFYFHYIVPTSPRQTSSELARENNKGATMVCNGPEPNLVLWMCLFVSFCFHPFAMFLTLLFFSLNPYFFLTFLFLPCMPPGFSVLLLDFCRTFCFAMILAFSPASIESSSSLSSVNTGVCYTGDWCYSSML